MNQAVEIVLVPLVGTGVAGLMALIIKGVSKAITTEIKIVTIEFRLSGVEEDIRQIQENIHV